VGEVIDAVETASFLFAGAIISIATSIMKRATRRVRMSANEAIQRQAELVQEVSLRRQVEEDLQKLNARLEDRVNERTFELQQATQWAKKSAEEAIQRQAELGQEVEMRRRVEQELQSLNARLEDRVNERTVELQGAFKELEAYAYSIAHNLRAPLRGVAGMSDLIEQETSSCMTAEGKNYLDRLRNAMLLMDALIQGLLEYSRVSREAFAQEPIPLADVVDEAVRLEYPALASRKAQITVKKPMPAMLGDRPALVEVLTQLLSNASKFVPSDRTPVIRVYTEIRETSVRLWVEDNGIGIDPQYQDRIFGVFEQLHQPATFPGTGIGLAIARRCMERMGGTVGVESALGKGSRFWIEAGACPFDTSVFAKQPLKGG